MKNSLNRMTSIIIIITLIFISGCSTEDIDTNSDKYKKIDELISNYHDKGQFTGTVLVSKDGKVIYKKGFGTVEVENLKIENKPSTKFLLYSCTKQFTAMLTLQLVEDGKINLDDKVTDILHCIPEGYLKKSLKKITVYNLLTHTSGLPDYYRMNFSEIGSKAFTSEEILNMLSLYTTSYEPSTKYSYSNTNYYLLGLIIEEITGKIYGEALEDNICKPLGMKNTGYTESDIDFINIPFVPIANLYSAGGIYSTVEDLHIWDLALYTDILLTKEYRDIMFNPFKDNYACGWGVVKGDINGKEITFSLHNGSPTPNGVKTTIVRTLEDRGSVIILANKGYIPNSLVNEIGCAVYDIKIDEKNK